MPTDIDTVTAKIAELANARKLKEERRCLMEAEAEQERLEEERLEVSL